MKVFLTKFHYQKKINLISVVLFILLCLPTLFYFIIICIRNFLYDINVIKSYKGKKSFIVSVGNITTGGTGKTPFVIKLANYFLDTKNEKTAVILRGYGGKLNNKNVNIVKNNGNIFLNANICGDEAFLIAKNTPNNCIVLTSKNRVNGINYAINVLGCKNIILDDCFQHRKVSPDLNLVLIDSKKLFGNGFVLPFGPLREPKFSIKKRASKIILVNKENDDYINTNNLINKLNKQYKKPVYECKMNFSKIYLLEDKEQVHDLKNIKNVYAFSAIASPKQFYKILKKYNLMGTKTYPDHYIYTQSDIDYMNKKAKLYNASILITTEKDAVKLDGFKSDLKIAILKMEPDFDIKDVVGY